MKNQRGFIVPLFLFIIAILVVGGGAYVYSKNNDGKSDLTTKTVVNATSSSITAKENSTQASSSKTLEESTTTVSKTIETSDWKSYENKTNGISFKYPKNYVVKENVSSRIAIQVEPEDIHKNPDNEYSHSLEIGIYDNSKNLSPLDWAKTNTSLSFFGIGMNDIDGKEYIFKKFYGKEALVYRRDGIEQYENIVFAYKSKMYLISRSHEDWFEDESMILDKVLESLKINN